jgi:hypothetical protein
MARSVSVQDAVALVKHNRILLVEAKEMCEAAREVIARAGRSRSVTPIEGADPQWLSRSGETLLALARRHVLEGERRVARQRVIIQEMESHHHSEVSAAARRVMETLQASLQLSRQHFERLKEASGRHPMGGGAL